MKPIDPPPASIYRIIYHSQIAFDGDDGRIMAYVKDILDWSRGWNPRQGITGALMVNDRHFSQVIEGPSSSVRALFGHIVCDKRHRNVELLQADYFHAREFGAWSMAFAGSATEPEIKLASGRIVTNAVTGTGAEGIVKLLRWLLSEGSVETAIR